MIHLLDTCICIDVIRGRMPGLVERFYDFDLAISAVTFAELEYGVHRSANPLRNKSALRRFCAGVVIYPFDTSAASIYGRIRSELASAGNTDWTIGHTDSRPCHCAGCCVDNE